MILQMKKPFCTCKQTTKDRSSLPTLGLGTGGDLRRRCGSQRRGGRGASAPLTPKSPPPLEFFLRHG